MASKETSPGQATKSVPVVLLSVRNPYKDCFVGGPAYRNAECEPWVDVNPRSVGTKAVNLIAVWQQDRWSTAGAHGNAAGFTLDGGKTWEAVSLPFSACAPDGLGYERASDPWVSFGPDGRAYASSLCLNPSNNATAIAAATSDDGGRTWSNLNVIQADVDPNFFNDKEAITADPTRPGFAYVVWDRMQLDPVPQEPTLFARTTDGGKTWSKPRVTFDPGVNNGTIGNQIVVDPRTGTLYNFFTFEQPSNDLAPPGTPIKSQILVQRSPDSGDTWEPAIVIADLLSVSVLDPNTEAPIRTGQGLAQPAVDPVTGDLYVVWQDARFNGGQFSEIAIASSRDGSLTWSEPRRVNKSTGRPAFTPTVKVNGDGVVGVSFYDFRRLTPTSCTLPTDVWLSTSTDAGITFESEVHVAGPFDMLMAPFASGFFVGDYSGLVAVGNAFQVVFVKTTGDPCNRTNVFVATVK